MPELPEVETVKESLKIKLLNKKIKNMNIYYENILAYPDKEKFQELIKEKVILDIKRRGKWLMFDLDNYYLLSHLRMEGKYFIKDINEEILKHEHIVFNLDDDTKLVYKDVRKFGKMYLIEKDNIYNVAPLKDIGLEPWDDNLNINYLKDKYKNKSLAIKTVLLDQSIIAGIGNIYADEILFLAKINPLKKAKELNNKELSNIIKYTKEVLEKAIKMGGTTIRSYTSVNGINGLFQQELNVHTKKVCNVCNKKIEKIRVNGRGTYYCPKCQK